MVTISFLQIFRLKLMNRVIIYLFPLAVILYGILGVNGVIESRKIDDMGGGVGYIWLGCIGAFLMPIMDFYKQNYLEEEPKREEKIAYEEYICNLVATVGTALFMLCFFSILNISEVTNDILLLVGLTSIIICGNRIYKKNNANK